MIHVFSLLLLYQLIGELIVRAFALPIPGPVIGMALLFLTLLARGRVGEELRNGTSALLQHLSLLFIPAGAGVMLHLQRIAPTEREQTLRDFLGGFDFHGARTDEPVVNFSGGEKARLAAQAGVVTEALERIIEANTYLSGIGFESSGLAAAHAIHNGFTILEECHHLYHGEKVAFGTLAQLVLQNSPMDEIETVLGFCQRVGLPVTLAQMGVKEGIDAKIAAVAKATCAEGETIHNMPFAVTPESVHAAILTADLLGQQWLAR